MAAEAVLLERIAAPAADKIEPDPNVFILADDLTGAADCAAAFLGKSEAVIVALEPRARLRAAVLSIDLDTRSLLEEAACDRVRQAFSGRRTREARILFKKIDSTLRGHVVAELRAAREALGSNRPVLVAPAFPAQGRTMRGSQIYVKGERLRGASLRKLAGEDGFLVCDAETDAGLQAIARTGLAMRPRPLFVGSAGLARALAAELPRRNQAPRPSIRAGSIAVAVGSASTVSARQAERLSRVASRLGVHLYRLDWKRTPGVPDLPLVQAFGRIAAKHAGCSAYVLTGGETARAALTAKGIRAFRLLGEVEPGVPFGISIPGNLLVCTKAGGFGNADTLVHCAMRMKREMQA